MDSQRLIPYMVLLFVGMLIFDAWQRDYAPKPQLPAETAPITSENGLVPGALPGAAADAASTINSEDLPQASTVPAASTTSEAISQTVAPASTSTRISVATDLADIVIDTAGGTIAGVQLLEYPVSIDYPDVPFTLASDEPGKFLIAQSGLQPGSDTTEAPTHKAIYTAEQQQYSLGEQDEIKVPMVWKSSDGVTVTKTLTFYRNSYEIAVDYAIENPTDKPWTVSQYQQLQRKPVTKDETQQFLYTYIGGVVSTDLERYEKIKLEKMAKESLSVDSTGGWVAMIQHYFAAAWLPEEDAQNKFYTIYLKSVDRYIIGMTSGLKTVAPQSTASFGVRAYIGPKVQQLLKDAAPHLELTVDFGWLTIIAQPLFWILKTIHGYIGNWGWSIILLTCMIKGVFYKLSKASYTSMARMKKLQPKLQSLKERYGDDRAKMGQATMDLYKKEKVNPLGGCLPMIVQIPVFIALYWTLLESVELRQAPWMLWIKDLSIKDPFYVLPVIMGVTMFIQQKLNPAPVDPIQAKVFMFLPLFFSVFFAFFPAGLVLYWCVNNSLSILQQYYITRHVLAEK